MSEKGIKIFWEKFKHRAGSICSKLNPTLGMSQKCVYQVGIPLKEQQKFTLYIFVKIKIQFRAVSTTCRQMTVTFKELRNFHQERTKYLWPAVIIKIPYTSSKSPCPLAVVFTLLCVPILQNQYTYLRTKNIGNIYGTYHTAAAPIVAPPQLRGGYYLPSHVPGGCLYQREDSNRVEASIIELTVSLNTLLVLPMGSNWYVPENVHFQKFRKFTFY